MCQSVFLIVITIGLLGLFDSSINCLPLYGEIESDLDTTKQSIVRANQILASINRDVDLCLSNSIACTLKSYDDLDYQTFESNQQQQLAGSLSSSSNSYSGSGASVAEPQPTTTTGYSEADEANVTQSPPIDSTGQPPMYGRVPPIKIVVSPASDQKFTHVLDDIDSLEVHVQSAITNFTSTRRYTYTAMLKPMLKHIHQLRNNLSLLHNRLIGVAALTNIASQVNELTDHISDAMVGGSDVPLDDSPSSPASSSTTSTTTTTTTSTTTSTPPPTANNQNPTTINSQSSPVVVVAEVSSTTIKVLPMVEPSSTTQSSSNPTTINDNDSIVATTQTVIGLTDDNVDELTITSTIKPINL